MAQWVKQPPVMPASHMRPGSTLAIPPVIELSANVPRTEAENGASAWAPDAQMGEMDEVPDSSFSLSHPQPLWPLGK